MRRSWRITAVTLFIAVVIVGSLIGDRLLALSNDTRSTLRLYTEMVEAAHGAYGGDVTYREVVNASIHGMLRTLDPHTSFLPPSAYERMRERQASSFYGLGILVGMRDGQLTVVSPLEGTPASRQGVRAGDIITTIDGEPTDDMTIDDAVMRLKGPKDTSVTINIARRGVTTELEMTIVRAEIPLTTVRYISMIDETTGYFRITDFSRATGQEVEDAIASLRDQGMQRLMIDLRNNGGGLLDQAIEVADQFVPEGGLIVETRGRIRDSFQRFSAEGKHDALDMPVVVLVNSGSASASEILAGAIQDHDIGIIVGTPTWGKGLVQTVYGLSYGSAIALTTASYYTPSGRLIQRDYTSVYDYYARSDVDGESDEAPSRVEAEVFYTDLGREVFGGGGITPDQIIEPDTIPEIVQYLAARNAFFEFGVEQSNRATIEDTDWMPEPELVDQFAAWLVTEEIVEAGEIEEELENPLTRDELLHRIRAEVFNSSLGNDAWYRVLAERDTQIQAAIDAFDEARDLLVQRRGLEPGAQVADARPAGDELTAQ